MMPNAGVRSRSYIARRAIPEAREGVLAQADPELRSGVEALLAQAERDAPQAPINILTNWRAVLKK